MAAKGRPVPLKPVAFQRITKAFYPYGDSAGRSTRNFEGKGVHWVQTSIQRTPKVTGRYRMTRRVKLVTPTGLYSKNPKPRGEESKAVPCDTRGSLAARPPIANGASGYLGGPDSVGPSWPARSLRYKAAQSAALPPE